MDNEKIVFAMYDIRAKQNYIYSGTRMKEIVGASLAIRDCFQNFLFPAAEEYAKSLGPSYNGIFNYLDPKVKDQPSAVFTPENFKAHLSAGYLGEVVYEGGGNFQVLFSNIEVYQEINRIFYRNLIKKTQTMRVLTSYIEGVDFDHYEDVRDAGGNVILQGDNSKLYEKHGENERKECGLNVLNALPIVQVDPRSSLPLGAETWLVESDLQKSKVTVERAYKYEMFRKANDRLRQGAEILDRMITRKGEDSHLAVIYIDGNNMGQKVQEVTKGKTSWAEALASLRQFSRDIQRDYIDEPMKKIDEELGGRNNRRFVIYAGDEITFICNVRDAFRVIRTYFSALPEGCSSCAGCAVFSSHAPFTDAYRIAEESCENGKKLMKEKGISTACLLDFHLCQGAVGTSLEKIRQLEGTETLLHPWLLRGDIPTYSYNEARIQSVAEALSSVARGNSKTLLSAAKAGDGAYQIEIERMKAHVSGNEEEKKILIELIDRLGENRELVYQMMIIFDFWFRRDSKGALAP